MICMICFEKKETRHIKLYPFGSEGLDICHKCEMQIVEYIRKLRREMGKPEEK